MIVEPSTRRMAFLHICRESGKVARGRLAVRDLERAWTGTGLRLSDLRAVVREMAERRLLVVLETGASKSFELTKAGLREIESPRDDVPTRVRDWITLQRVKLRRRKRTLPEGSRRRRKSDQI